MLHEVLLAVVRYITYITEHVTITYIAISHHVTIMRSEVSHHVTGT